MSGVTTNPTLASKENRNYRECVKEIAEIVDGPISAEAISSDWNEMVAESKEIAAIANNINVKIPMSTEGLRAIKALSSEGVRKQAEESVSHVMDRDGFKLINAQRKDQAKLSLETQ